MAGLDVECVLCACSLSNVLVLFLLCHDLLGVTFVIDCHHGGTRMYCTVIAIMPVLHFCHYTHTTAVVSLLFQVHFDLITFFRCVGVLHGRDLL